MGFQGRSPWPIFFLATPQERCNEGEKLLLVTPLLRCHGGIAALCAVLILLCSTRWMCGEGAGAPWGFEHYTAGAV